MPPITWPAFALLISSAAATESLVEIVRSGTLSRVREAVKSGGIDLNAFSPVRIGKMTGITPLIAATLEPDKEKRAELVNILLDAGSDVNVEAEGGGGGTALTIAVLQNSVETCELLLGQDAIEVDGTDASGNPLIMAAQLGHAEITSLLIDAGADPNWYSPSPIDATPLLMAAAKGRLDVVELLLAAGAKLGFENSKGVSAHVAAALDVPVSPHAKAMMERLLVEQPPVCSTEEVLLSKPCDGPAARCDAIALLRSHREAERRAAGSPIWQWLKRKWYLVFVFGGLFWQRYEKKRRRRRGHEE